MHLFDGPLILHESPCEPVQEFRMACRFTPSAEITGRRHQSYSKMLCPDPVHHDARGQWVVGTRDGEGHFSTTAPMLERHSLRAGDDFQKLTGHLLAFQRRIAALEHEGAFLVCFVREDHRVWRGVRVEDVPPVDLSL